jgi:hypothetical protein
MLATDYRRRQAVMVSAGGHALRERARPDPDPVQIRELSSEERARIRAGGPAGIRELRERFESVLSELAELRAHRGDAERAELELRNELEATRTQLSDAVTQLGTTRDQLAAARADAEASRTDAAASAARAERFEQRLAEAAASAARAEHVEAELAQTVARAQRAEAQLEIALRPRPEPVAAPVEPPPVRHAPVKVEHVSSPTIDAVGVDDVLPKTRASRAPAPEITPVPPVKAPAPVVPAPGAPIALDHAAGVGAESVDELPKNDCAEFPRAADNFDECMAELRDLNAGSEEPSKDGRWGVGAN